MFYKDMCFASLQPVLDTIKLLAESDIWLEITNLIIPGHNDDMRKIDEMCAWIKENAGKDTPLHFSRFFPHHKMKDLKPTPEETMMKAVELGKKQLKHVYVGNMTSESGENTYCHRCNKLLIGRSGFGIIVNKIKEGRCPCGEKIAGVW